MVIKGKPRGHGRQLASYLLTLNENEAIRILDVDGMRQFTEKDLRNFLGDMSLNEQLTRSRKGLYHAVINPSPNEALKMSDKDWQRAADILAGELGFQEQRRAIVLHKKQLRTHAHVVYDRYNHEQGIMIDVKKNYYKHDKARARMEAEFQHTPTARRNPRRPEMKKTLTALWQQAPDATSFMKAAKKEGYTISQGFGRIPYMVVDHTGRSFNLVRHLDGIKMPEVRQRLKDKVLISEKDAIAFVRTQQTVTHKAQPETPKPDSAQEARNAFLENMNKLRQQQQGQKLKPRL
ncbi:relaxase/mobilization nuclease domain-containing protein [Taibaiella koreensis]|uniref:relaxase/mobilization nuclease domain-containing protein n=1 Tax=Taibaiella koreensis TaxID=1268548 RepID=UPI000E5A0527|nr:relaxase/mobilization nuclease domain-containing protein [Taibaiella koreensis]